MKISRRRFLGSATAISLGFGGLGCSETNVIARSIPRHTGFGPLKDDPKGIIALPDGFSYRIVSRRGEMMSDGFYVPARHDGMATFPGPDGMTLIVRNHEIAPGADPTDGAFGADMGLLARLDSTQIYDAGTSGIPVLGGTTTLLYDTRNQDLVSHHLSLAGTAVNCAGGPTPWGTWISCEETTEQAGSQCARDHGYNFEVHAGLRVLRYY